MPLAWLYCWDRRMLEDHGWIGKRFWSAVPLPLPGIASRSSRGGVFSIRPDQTTCMALTEFYCMLALDFVVKYYYNDIRQSYSIHLILQSFHSRLSTCPQLKAIQKSKFLPWW
jgi:hypothetical protein